VLAHGRSDLGVGERRAPHVGRRRLAGDGAGARVGDDEHLLRLGELVGGTQRRGRVHDADHDVDLVLLQDALDRRHARVGTLALVGDDGLDLVVAHHPVVLLEPEVPALLHVLAERRVDAGLRDDQPDLDRAAAALAAAVTTVPAGVPAEAAASAGREEEGQGGGPEGRGRTAGGERWRHCTLQRVRDVLQLHIRRRMSL
jgi:hypothetical protein